MVERPASRRWQVRDWTGTWQEVLAVDGLCVVMGSGQGMAWRVGKAFLPDPGIAFRYTIWFGEDWMPWRPGDVALLLQDFNHPEVAEQVRVAQSQDRQLRAYCGSERRVEA